MNVSFEPQLDSQDEIHAEESARFARAALSSVNTAARGGVVNRTHRVVRQRAKAMQERRSYMRSLLVPLALCATFLTLTCVAVWTGLYQYQATEAAEAVEADVAALANFDANNHFLVLLLWFVPVTLALVGAVVFRRVRSGAGQETIR
jgi:hypothetical protein